MDESRLKLTRRRVLAGGLVGAGTLATGGAVALAVFRSGGDSPSSPAQPGVIPTLSPTSEQPAKGTALPNTRLPGLLSFLEPSSGEFERREFALSDTIDWTSGVFYMNTRTGAMTAYQRAATIAHPPSAAVTAVGPRFVAALDSPELLLDRNTGAEWRWDANGWRLMAATDSFLVFAESRTGKDVGRYVIARADLKSAIEFKTGVSTWTQWTIHDKVAAFVGQEWRDRVALVDLTSGTTRTVFAAPAALNGKHSWGVSIQPDRDDSFTALYTCYENEQSDQYPSGPAEYLLQRISWNGDLLDTSFGPRWFESDSPDGKYRIRETVLHTKPSVGEGSGEAWSAIELLTADGFPLLRVRSAALAYGDSLPRNRWLADSSAFVAMIRDLGEPRAPNRPFRYALISPRGAITELPTPPVEPDQWYKRPGINGPVPSLRDPDLLSFGRFYLFNRRTGDWFIPKMTDTGGPAHWYQNDSPWMAGPDEMVFSLGHGGHGGSGAPALIASLVEQSPFPNEARMRFRVERTGSCLNMRDKPDQNASIVSCLPDGTIVELDPQGEALWEGAQQGYSHATSATGTWALVTAPGGLRGWVSPAYLGWAT